MMKGVDGTHAIQSTTSGQHQVGATSPTLIHQQDLSGVIAGNSHFRYDDSVAQQKGRSHLSNYQQSRDVGQFGQNEEGLYFENSMRQSDQDMTSL